MKNPNQTAVAFAGSDTQHLVNPGNVSTVESDLREKVTLTIRSLYARGYRTFISTLTDGFALWAADTALMLKEAGDCPDLKLIAFICREGQDEEYDELQRATYRDLVANSDKVILMPDREDIENQLCAGHRMLDYCSLLVCYAVAEDEKALRTVAYARKVGVAVLDLSVKVS